MKFPKFALLVHICTTLTDNLQFLMNNAILIINFVVHLILYIILTAVRRQCLIIRRLSEEAYPSYSVSFTQCTLSVYICVALLQLNLAAGSLDRNMGLLELANGNYYRIRLIILYKCKFLRDVNSQILTFSRFYSQMLIPSLYINQW